jgi:hypothetical protein
MTVSLGYKFAAIPEWVLYHPDLTGDDVRTFGVLARYGNEIRPSLGTIADRIGKSRPTAKRCVERLVEVGALRVEQRRGDDGSQLPNLYHLAGDAPFDPRFTRDPGVICEGAPQVTGDPPPGSPVTHEREQDRESKNNESPPSPRKRGKAQEYTPRFEAWWKQYPRAIDKAQASRAFERLTDADKAAAEGGLQKWLDYWTAKNEPDKVPHPTTWLNRSRWEANPPPVAQRESNDIMDRARRLLRETQTGPTT